MASNPNSIRDVEQLEELLSTPTPGAIQVMGTLEDDIMVLGVGGRWDRPLREWQKELPKRRE